MPDIGWYGLILAVAAGSTAALTVPAKRIAVRVGYIAHPGDRSVHKKPIPYGGGASMFLGFLVAVLLAATLPPFRAAHTFTDSPEMLGVVLAAGAMFAVGLIDDVRDMSAPAKMAGQVLAASILYFAGVTMYELKIPLAGFYLLTPGIIPLITAIWVIALTNAVNLIDGLDGLAAGVVAIGGGALALYGIRLMGLGLIPSDNIGPLVAVIACGICLGFLPFNFNPARIFMGDAGAHFLGLLMAASTMVIGGRVPTAVPISGVTYFFFAPLFIPLFILGVPLVDMAFAFIRRTARGQKFDTPDKEHIHHRLLNLGHGPRRSVIILWAWTAVLSSFLLFPLFVHQVNAIIPIGAAALGVGLYTFFHPGLRRGNGQDEDKPPDQEIPSSNGQVKQAPEVVRFRS
ncbi:MAG TPA: MraY family glycosyltransferase [Methylomirabilota bacterium]|jgi:UDP-GlcNAc:undecaprenyl-phosphate GlcNAc-1-phosphate transferase|nr:MraY family glycosyltransferase [Methylomirabilota bacterium]HXB36838.1 MraY family glycosyltransferase [Acidimicrobiales bacterium]